MTKGLVYIGKIIQLTPISGADFIVSATVVCGHGGRWEGVVQKSDYSLDSFCLVYLPDSLIPPCEELSFMEKRGWRVRMCKFKGVRSEVLIVPLPSELPREVGLDCTELMKVTKYEKPIPASLAGLAKGNFPSFIPKTDEPNYQRSWDLIEALLGKPYYITEKADGSSTTAYRYKGEFGVCSRNLELKRDENNAYWKIAIRYKLEETLPEGYAIQWETCGPGIQKNPMGWNSVQGLLFSAYNIEERRYCTFLELCELSIKLDFPMVQIYKSGLSFSSDGIESLGEGTYDNGTQREGIVVRSQENILGHKPVSFKVINLNYKD